MRGFCVAIASLLFGLSAAASPNVLLITVDTLRADRLGCHGYALPTSPNIDALAAESLVFEDVLVEEPQTGPSMISMFTSRYPRATGTVRNAVPVSGEVPTIAEAFRAAGYQTGAVVSNWNLKRDLSNLARGFDYYDDDFGRNFIGIAKEEKKAKAVTESALAWLDTRDESRPYFFWAHYMDPHSPYHFRGEYNVHDALPKDLDDEAALDARYDSEVRYADHYIGRLLERVPRENTYIVFTADHGESLLEHGYLGHTREVYQTTMRVPLTIAGPGVGPGRSDAPVRGVDVGPTLLALAGIEGLPGMAGADVLGGGIESGRARVFETYDGDVPDGDNVRAQLADRAPSRQGIVSGKWKLIVREGEALLFDLSTDPNEETNLAEEHPKTVEHLMRSLREWDASTPRNEAAGASLNNEDREALEALGYIE